MAAALPLSLSRLRGRQGRETRAADRRRACRSPAISRCPWPARRRPRASRRARPTNDFEFEYSKYSGWPEIKESLMANRIQAALHAGAAGHGSRRQEDPGEDRFARPSLGRGDHGAHGFALSEIRRPARQTHRHPEPLRGRLPVPAQDAGAREHDAGGHRDHGDAAARHAGGAVRQRRRCVLHGRAVRRRRAARRLRARAAHDARRVAQLHLLRAHRARGTDRREPRRWSRTW